MKSCQYCLLLHMQLSLFFDILLCMTTDLDKEEYVGGAFKHVILTPTNLNPLLKRAREKLWEALRGTSMRAGTCIGILPLYVVCSLKLSVSLQRPNFFNLFEAYILVFIKLTFYNYM